MTAAQQATILALPYIDVQHDAMTVFDDITQGVVAKEDIWISGYRAGSTSVHGKVTLEPGAGEASGSRGVSLTPKNGVEVERIPGGDFRVSFPALSIGPTTVKFPRQVIHPPYPRPKSTTPPLHINALAYSARKNLLAVAGPDGFLCILPAGMQEGKEGIKVFKGHVGDALDVKFFPSGEVILSASSDLSLRIWGLDTSNPRTLRGHTRGITCTTIIGVGKQILSGSRDGTVRLWTVGEAKEVRKWTMEGRVPVEEILLDETGEVVLVFKADGSVQVLRISGEELGELKSPKGAEGKLVSAAWDRGRGLVAVGYTTGVIHLREVSLAADKVEVGREAMVRRNEAAVYSLAWTSEGDLLVGTAAGLPCRLGVRMTAEGIEVGVKEEMAGWEAVGVEAWAVAEDGGVWCAGGEGGIRRYH